ncbi:zinc finger protein 512B isoform X2 [Denticeps clupeoides]|uniref:zinc finger protein 512B isoform X2 n=1 Tax=Denticeps clupeoides TaxID=299321 RepID=UPI0010A3414D|nr:zinc finger protein 512B isoform X2 [Denticeps clupeoides]
MTNHITLFTLFIVENYPKLFFCVCLFLLYLHAFYLTSPGMETSSAARLGKSPSGMAKGRLPKQAHPSETARTGSSENDNHGPTCNERAEGKRKGRPRVEVQELRSIPSHMMLQWKEEFKNHSRVKCPSSGCWLEFPSIYGLKYHYQRCQGDNLTERLSHACPYCEAVFATKVRLQKHKLWNHPERVNMETKTEAKGQKVSMKGGAKKRPMENSPPSPVFFKVKKMHEASQPSQNGECAMQKPDRKQLQAHTQHQAASSDASPRTPGGSESEGGSLPPPYPEEDPERSKHRRKQKTPKKFTGEQPSISGTFGLKGMNKVEEKLKAGRAKHRAEGTLYPEEPQRKLSSPSVTRRDPPPTVPGPPAEAQWHQVISERGEVVCPTCSVVTRKTVPGLKKHMEICQKLQDALKCPQCQKQFRSKAGLNYHSMAEHSAKSAGSESPVRDEQEERERLRRVLRQMGKIKCPSEGCSAHFASLMGYQYHQKRCGRDMSEDEKPLFQCQHCGKTYRSKAGRDYHVRSEHPVAPSSMKGGSTEVSKPAGRREQPLLMEKQKEDMQRKQAARVKDRPEELSGTATGTPVAECVPPPLPTAVPPTASEAVEDFERTPSGRVRRRSAQVAVFHLQEIAEDELAKDWGTKRRIKDDLVPDIKRLNYTRPGLPKFSPRMLETWKNEVKEKGFICCSNGNCEAVYSSVSGLKAHLANCNKGDGAVGKYMCLLCQKEFSSESGVKYHISKTHSQNWFRTASHMVPSSKRKESESNGIKYDVKNGATGKKRGRKPKERPQEAEPVLSKTPSTNPVSVQVPPPAQSSATVPPPSAAQSPNATPTPAYTSGTAGRGDLIQSRDMQPTVRKRGKPKKLPSNE